MPGVGSAHGKSMPRMAKQGGKAPAGAGLRRNRSKLQRAATQQAVQLPPSSQAAEAVRAIRELAAAKRHRLVLAGEATGSE